MRRWIVSLAVAALIVGLYLASPFLGLYRLGSALHEADAAGLVARVDIPSVRRSIVEQIVAEVGRDAEVERQLNKLGGVARDMALRAAAGEFDRMLAATVTPEVIRLILAKGDLPPEFLAGQAEPGRPVDASAGASVGLPDNPLRFLRTFDYVSPRKVRATIGEADRPEEWTGLTLLLRGATWRLTEVALPPAVLARVRPAIRARIDALRP
ncbi:MULTISPECIES: DUF2939 domain-containing protein [unclassified Aureimonas]|uniref:DUF2939 domain-containing protein n=1 Tax=unclassified Aureimonas TaxID=2615206 RepID=UPI000AD4D9E3|nr:MULTISPECIES: DUF2939 domain-containing protein [unclassified Aureimonas]